MDIDDPLSAEAFRRYVDIKKAEEALKTKFGQLEKYRDTIQTNLKDNYTQRTVLGWLHGFGVKVSADTLSRYVRHVGFVKKRRRKGRQPAKQTV